MREYIFYVPEENEPIGDVYYPDERDDPMPVEPLVQCRDCKFYTPESMTREERGFGVYENMWEPGGCFNPERCHGVWDDLMGQMVPVGIDTEPDGYCAWGERREA